MISGNFPALADVDNLQWYIRIRSHALEGLCRSL